jgi:hypothetical protein
LVKTPTKGKKKENKGEQFRAACEYNSTLLQRCHPGHAHACSRDPLGAWWSRINGMQNLNQPKAKNP